MRYVLDTTAFSAAMRQDAALLELLGKYRPGNILTVPPVVAEIQYGIERLDNTDALIDSVEPLIYKLHPDDADLDDYIEKIIDVVGKCTSAISLSMNIVHTSGNIMEDYGDGFGLENVDKDFLDDFNERNIDDWREELQKIIK